MTEQTHEAEPGRTAECMSRDDEQRLISRAQRGNEDAFRDLVDAYKDRLFAFVGRMLRNRHEAEDVCQSAFVRAYESLESYNPQYAFSTWLFTIAYRLCLNHLRRRRTYAADVELAQLGTAEPDTAVTVANSEEARELSERVWTAVAELTPAQKSAVLLFYREGKSCQEIGRVLNMPSVTVKSHLHRARERLRGLLGKVLGESWTAERRGPAGRAGSDVQP